MFHHGPLYREVVRDAWHAAWHERQWWLFALFAGILQTGGIYDAILFFTKGMADQSYSLLSSASLGSIVKALPVLDFSSLNGFFVSLAGEEQFLFALLIIAAILLCSVIAQGALVAGLGGRLRGRANSFRGALAVGAKKAWHVAGLNVVTLGLLWVCRFLVLIPVIWSYQHPTVPNVVTYFFFFLLFLVATIALTTVHIFALQAMVLNDASLHEALSQAFHLWKKSWLIILELAAVLFVVGVVILFVASLLFLLMSIPLWVILFTASLLHYPTLYWLSYLVTTLMLLFIMLGAGMFTIAFYYATWSQLYRRVGEGRVMAKLHRWLHWITNLHPSKL